MAETCWEIINADISQWGSWCRLFHTSDNKWFVIDADVQPVPSWITTVIRRKTAVFWCNENGGVTDLIADYEYAPMTTAEVAVQLMGYELTNPPAADSGQPSDFGSTA